MKSIKHLQAGVLVRLLAVSVCVTMIIPACSRRGDSGAVKNNNQNDQVAEIIKQIEEAINHEADPCQDFYEFACGSWLSKTKIPPGASSTDWSFAVVTSRNQAFVQDLLNGKIESKDRYGLEQLQIYYNSCMDEAAIEQLGLKPLQPWIDQVKTVSDLTEFFKVVGLLQTIGVPALFGSTIFPDSKNPTVNLLQLTQGFDRNGRGFNAQGQQQDWWSAEASRQFNERAACFVKQYGAFEALPGLFINGSQTLNENIADNGGLKLAYYAYQLWKSRGGQSTSPIEGLNDDQLFFVAFAQTWSALYTEAATRVWVANDPHSLAKFRVNGAVTNFPEFSQVFACSKETSMNPKNRCVIW